MKKIISFFLVLVLGICLCACAAERQPIVGVWHTYILGATHTYTFKSNGTYQYTVTGSIELQTSGKYTLDKSAATITLNDKGEKTAQSVFINDCCMTLNGVKYGKVYSGNDSCAALDQILGSWHNIFLPESKLKFNNDGTYELTGVDGDTAIGVYLFDPSTSELEILDADLVFVFENNSKPTLVCPGKSLIFNR